MSTSSEKYEVAQDEVEALVAKLSSTIRDTEAAQGEAKKRLVQVCSGLFEEAARSLEEMDGEARAAPLQFRAEMLASVRRHRSDLNSLQTKFTKARVERAGAGRRNSGAASSSSHAPVQDQYRQQVLAGTEILARTGDSLSRAQQVAIETDEVGNEIITDLGSQRESLERTRARLAESDVELGRSRKILRKMYVNVFSNKIILIVIIVIEILILCGVVYWKYLRKKK